MYSLPALFSKIAREAPQRSANEWSLANQQRFKAAHQTALRNGLRDFGKKKGWNFKFQPGLEKTCGVYGSMMVDANGIQRGDPRLAAYARSVLRTCACKTAIPGRFVNRFTAYGVDALLIHHPHPPKQKTRSHLTVESGFCWWTRTGSNR
jgi:hypothetical protein